MNSSGMVVIRLSIVVIRVLEILLVIIFGLFVLNRVIWVKVLIILVIVLSRFSSGVILVVSFRKFRLKLSFGVFCRMVLLSFSLMVLVL